MVVTCSAPCRSALRFLSHETSPKKDAEGRNMRASGRRVIQFDSDTQPSRGAQSMAKIVFTPKIQRHIALPQAEASGRTVRDVLEAVFADHPQARGYVLDDQSALRKHMTIFVDGQIIHDRTRLTDAVSESSTVYVFQALSGG